MRSPTLSFTTIEDDPDIAPVLKVSAQLCVPVQTAAGHYEEEHAYVFGSGSFEVIGATPGRSVTLIRPEQLATAG